MCSDKSSKFELSRFRKRTDQIITTFLGGRIDALLISFVGITKTMLWSLGCPVSEFKEFEQQLKSAKNWFKLGAGLNLKKLNTSLEPTIFEPRLKFKPKLKFLLFVSDFCRIKIHAINEIILFHKVLTISLIGLYCNFRHNMHKYYV